MSRLTSWATVLVVFMLAFAGCANEKPQKNKPTTNVSTVDTVDTADTADTAPTPKSSPAEQNSVPIEVLVGELIMTKLDGPIANAEELSAVKRLHIGGVILFGWNVTDEPQLKALTDSLNSARLTQAKRYGLPPRMLVSVDQEGGSIRNIPFAPPAQTARELGTENSPIKVEKSAYETGAALSKAGVNILLGPVADLASPPARVMAGRAFSDSAEDASKLVAAAVRGAQRGGVAATAKHFPGFGASTANSDDAVAFVDRSKSELSEKELNPYRAALDEDVQLIMVSHGIHRRFNSTLPGVLDAKIATDLLRKELGFQGVAITDSMNARGLREGWGDTIPRACPKAVAAGIDLLLLTGSLETATLCRARIIDAVKTGTLKEAQVRAAAERVIRLREWVTASSS